MRGIWRTRLSSNNLCPLNLAILHLHSGKFYRSMLAKTREEIVACIRLWDNLSSLAGIGKSIYLSPSNLLSRD